MAKSNYRELTSRLASLLDLEVFPIAIYFLSTPPPNIKRVKKPAAGCSMWKQATEQAVYATGDDHYPCAAGAEIMGFTLTAKEQVAKADFNRNFVKLGIFTEEGVKRREKSVPKIKTNKADIIVYGPLEEASADPDVVLLTCKPAQAMELAEACGRQDGDAPVALLNMAGCALISAVYLYDKQGISLACHGSRNYAEIAPDKLLYGIPGKQLAVLVENLEKMVIGRKRYKNADKK